MKLSRLLLYGATLVVLVLLLALGMALTSTVQTWAVHKVIARHPGWHLEVGRISAGFGSVVANDVTYERGGTVLTIPQVEAKLPILSAVLFKRLTIHELVAHGWTLNASCVARHPANAEPADNSSHTAATGVSGAVAAGAPAGVRPLLRPQSAASGGSFSGVLAGLQLPFEVSLERVDLAGAIILPATRGTANLTVTGGGLRANGEGILQVHASSALRDTTVSALDLQGAIAVVMSSPRSFGRIAGDLQATASGGKLGQPVHLTLGFGIASVATGENYTVRLSNPQRTLLLLDATRPGATRHISGRWTLDMRDVDVAPFALGRALPAFGAIGEGEADTDGTFSVVHVRGRLDASVDHLDLLDKQLSEIGAIRLTADVDLTQRADVFSVSKLNVVVAKGQTENGATSVAGSQPNPISPAKTVAMMQALQSFEFSPHEGEVQPTDPSRDLIGVTLQGVPLSWTKPFVDTVSLTGSDITGELVATPRAGGFTVRTKAPISVAGLNVSRLGVPLLQRVNVSINASGDYNLNGWQAELTGVTAKTGATTVLLIDAKAGQLAGDHQPIKTTGLLSVDLAALLAQPAARGLIALQRGDATLEFVGSWGAAKQFEAKIVAKNLAADPQLITETLPAISMDLRTDIGADGRLTLNAPIVLERDGRKSDLTLIGTFAAPRAGGAFEAQATSTRLVVQDAKVFSVLVRPTPGAGGASTPWWAGLNGSVALQLKQLIYSDAFQLTNVTGTLRLSGGAVTFDNVHSGVGEGQAAINGKLTMHPESQQFQADSELSLVDFDPGPLFRSRLARTAPLFEGKFAIDSRLAAHATKLEDLPEMATGDFTATSKAGIFRALPVNVGNLVENSSKLATWLASAGNAIAGLVSRKEDVDEISNRSQAANELAKALSAISYDQLRMVMSRDETLNTTVKEFSVISPDVRLSGNGYAIHLPGRSISDDEVTLELQLRARGRVAELLKYLGILDPKPDDLGYAACTIPMKVSGSLGALDGRDFSNRLIASAVSKTGILDKAGARAMDWINRLRGRF